MVGGGNLPLLGQQGGALGLPALLLLGLLLGLALGGCPCAHVQLLHRAVDAYALVKVPPAPPTLPGHVVLHLAVSPGPPNAPSRYGAREPPAVEDLRDLGVVGFGVRLLQLVEFGLPGFVVRRLPPAPLPAFYRAFNEL